MIEGWKSVTETEIEFVKEQLSIKDKGKLRRLFYQRNGLPKNGLFSNLKILTKLKIMDLTPNTLESEGINRLLSVALAKLRKQAKSKENGKIGLPWIDVATNGKQAYHGFSEDIEKIVENADKFAEIAKSREAIAQNTSAIAKAQIKRLQLESQSKITA